MAELSHPPCGRRVWKSSVALMLPVTSQLRQQQIGSPAGIPGALLALGLPAALSGVVEAWSGLVEDKVSCVAKATGLIRFELSFDSETGCRTVQPRHCVIIFSSKDHGKTKHLSALFRLRVVREEELSRDPNSQGAVANHLRFKPPDERRKMPGADEYVEFELLSREHEVPSQQSLRVSMGPMRVNSQSGQLEFVRIDMEQCIKQIATDIIEDPGGGAERLVQNRWWMCIETLRLLCRVDDIDCTALDQPGVPPLGWVIRLVDRQAPMNGRESLQAVAEDRNLDELLDFIDNSKPGKVVGPSQKTPKGKKKKGQRQKR